MSVSSSAVETLVADLKRVFGDRLLSVVIYGPHTDGNGGDQPIASLALAASVGIADLEACARQHASWRRLGLETPLLLAETEFRRSLDAFPLEYREIVRAHQRVYGSDPFVGLAIAPEDLRRACETQIKSHLVHLREGFIEAGGRPHAIEELVALSAPAFTALLRHVAHLGGLTATDRVTLTKDGARQAGISDSVVAAMLSLERPTALATTDGARLFPDYLAAVEHLARYVDTWRH